MIRILFLLTALPFFSLAQSYQLQEVAAGKKTSMRGLSVVNDDVAWVSGNNGQVGQTINGGKNWTWVAPKGYETVDFRDIEAFSDQKAIVMGIASPAYILLTEDAGNTWKEVYKNIDSMIFLDGMDFWDDKRGIAYGDPIDQKMQLLLTNDGGQTWRNISAHLNQKLAVGEASFAASGTAIRTAPTGKIWIATGGAVSNIYYSANYGKSWKVYSCPIIQGESGTGPFSLAFFNAKKGIVVGGNYLKDSEHNNNILLTKNGGKSWFAPQTPVFGYRSAVEYISKDLCFATGTSGTDVSTDGGLNWLNISKLNFNTVKKAKKGGLILLTGNRGEIFRLLYE